MEYLSVESAQAIVRRARLVAEYTPGVGARCPLCGDWGERLYRCVVRPAGDRIERRYHICVACQWKFRSERKITPPDAPNR